MGAWGSGPFDNDDAADFLDTLEASPSKGLIKALRKIAAVEAGGYIEVDAGSAAWAACEIVALAFGRAGGGAVDDLVVEIVRRVRAQEALRLLALSILPRIADRETSELSGLWHEGGDGAAFDSAMDQLASRLQDAASGVRVLPAPKSGDVFALPAGPPSDALIVVQVVGAREVAVFEGTFATDAAALLCVKDHRARRVPAFVTKLSGEGRLLGNVPVRANLKGKKLYASESGAIDVYYLMTAAAGGYREVDFEEARAHESLFHHDADAVRSVAQGRPPFPCVRSPEEREADLYERSGGEWNARRSITKPGPFGDVEAVEGLLQWIEMTGVSNVIEQFGSQADGLSGYGRPNEQSERQAYAFAGLVALWRGTWPHDMWPSFLGEQPPPRPNEELMARALAAARVLASRVVTRDAELRLIWDGAPDGGAELRKIVASLQAALAE